MKFTKVVIGYLILMLMLNTYGCNILGLLYDVLPKDWRPSLTALVCYASIICCETIYYA